MEKKLDLNSLSLDNILGDGLDSIQEDEQLLDEQIEDTEDTEEVEDNNSTESDDDLNDSDDSDDLGDSDSDIDSVASEIAKTLGFEIESEYADTVEGLTEFTRDLGQQIAEEQLNRLFEQFPEVQKHLDYMLAGGDSKKFFEAYNPNTDYNNFKISEKDVNSQRAVLAQYLQLKGHDNDFIQEMLEDYEDSGKLYSKAAQAQSALAKSQEEYRQNLILSQKQEQQRIQQETEQFWEGVAGIIESGNEFAGIRIPDKQKSKFFDYISEPIGKNGETQRDIDYANAELEVKLAMDYLMYNGFKLEDIINTKAKTVSAKNLKDRIVGNESRVKSASKASRQQRNFDPDNLDMTALF
jgi:hypothetical protein